MDWGVLLGVINLVAVSAVLILMLVKSGRSASGEVSAAQFQRLEQTVMAADRLHTQRGAELQQVIDRHLAQIAQHRIEASKDQIKLEAAARQELHSVLGQRLSTLDRAMLEVRTGLSEGLDHLRTENARELERIRTELGERLHANVRTSLQENSARIDELIKSAGDQQERLRVALREEMEQVRAHNEAQLEKMRHTVDEKLQGTLEKRLGDSFHLVSQRLEQVQKGLGEMRNLASDVGGLKRVLSNVKTRGTWGEVQLGRQLEDTLAPSQYGVNVAVDPSSTERVEFAIKLPGTSDDTPVYLPVDSKFPQEPYERLLAAQELGDTAAIDASTKELERALRVQAAQISGKYVKPPWSTDFAIMYLPTEGLFAEALRIPGLASDLQTKERIMITGPTTLMSLLNSLQMGFKTLAIEQRSSEVWKVLAAAKDEFGKYGIVWERLGKQLQTAQRTVDEVGRRTRAVQRQLQDVETLHPVQGSASADVLNAPGIAALTGPDDSME